jgi:hypothetical protein
MLRFKSSPNKFLVNLTNVPYFNIFSTHCLAYKEAYAHELLAVYLEDQGNKNPS